MKLTINTNVASMYGAKHALLLSYIEFHSHFCSIDEMGFTHISDSDYSLCFPRCKTKKINKLLTDLKTSGLIEICDDPYGMEYGMCRVTKLGKEILDM